MNRVLLINKIKTPTRAELVTSERRTGELLFTRFPSLNFAGYVIAQNRGRMAANWIVPQEIFEPFKDFLNSTECETYDIELYANGKTPHGGQKEVQVA